MVKQLPWRLMMSVLRLIRNRLYQKKKPDHRQIVAANVTAEELDNLLRNEDYFEEAEEFTYLYEGEVLNLRRPAGIEEDYQMVIHVRGFEHPQGVEIMAHYEISRFDSPRDHLNNTIFSREKGQHAMEQTFDRLGVEHIPTPKQ